MSGFRRSARTQSRRPMYGETEDYHQQMDTGQAHMMMNQGMGMMMGNMGMGMMNMGGAWQMPHHGATDGYYNTGYQYQQPHAGYATQHGYPHQQQQHQQQQYYTQYQQQQQHQPPSEVVPTGNEEEPVAGPSRSLRARQGLTQFQPYQVPPSRPKGPSSVHAEAGSQYGPVEDDDGDAESSAKSKSPLKLENTLTVDQMVQNCLFYLLLQQHKKIPIKRSDLIKHAMESNNRQFAEVMNKLDSVLTDIFGMSLVRLDRGADNQPCISTGAIDGSNTAPPERGEDSASKKIKGKGKGASSSASASYILVSKYPSSVFNSSMLVMARHDLEVSTKKTVLYLVLATIFMLNQPIDEDIIWKIIDELEFKQMVCEKREDLRKFLKSEYVGPTYLNMETFENQNHPNVGKVQSESNNNDEHNENMLPADYDTCKAKYSWGPRAHKEYSKSQMLKFVAARFPGRQLCEFTAQFNAARLEEKDSVDREFQDDRVTDEESEDGDNGSALKIKKGRKGEAYAIDGENAETETEEGA